MKPAVLSTADFHCQSDFSFCKESEAKMSLKTIDKKSRDDCDIGNLIRDNMRLGEITYVPASDLNLPQRRLRKHPERQIVGLKASIRTFGIVAPLLVDQSNTVIDGEAMLEAIRQLGISQVPIVRIDHLSGDEIRLLRLTLV